MRLPPDRDQFEPFPDDPNIAQVISMFDARADNWVMTGEGDYQAAAALGCRSDGSEPRHVVILEWPGRINHTDERVQIRMMMAPEDALGLADVLSHAGRWLRARAALFPDR